MKPRNITSLALIAAFFLTFTGSSVAQTAPAEPLTHPAQSFVVHEWGTFTTLAGSDGVLLPGLYHEEESLPQFVHYFSGFANGGFIRKGLSLECDSVTLKMETPVIYFYSDKARSVDVHVGWPAGTISQWYPDRDTGEMLDQSEIGHLNFSTKHNGWIDWKANVLAKSPDDTNGLTKFDETHTWTAPRATDANVVSYTSSGATAPEVEKFLFYRGVGNAKFMDGFNDGHYILSTAFNGNKLEITNTTLYNILFAMVFERTVDPVTGDSTNLVWWSGPINGDEKLECSSPRVSAASTFESTLAQFRDKLVEKGLYLKEANAMLETWRQSYFGTPGLRVFWIVPKLATEASLPMTISPKPDDLQRILVARSEILTPAFEKQLLTDYQQNQYKYYNDRYYLAYQSRVQTLLLHAGVTAAAEAGPDVSLFPNPSTGTVSVFNAPKNLLRVSVTNILGDEVLAIPSPAPGELTFDLSTTPVGSYIVKFVTTSGVTVRRIVKE